MKKDGRIILGEGGFGKVRIALSLLENISKPGDMICVKKTKPFKKAKT